MNLSYTLFWDSDISQIDYQKNARQIIARVLQFGTLNDWIEINKYYGVERIKQEVVNIRYLDKLSLNFCSKIFDIPLEKFRCYNTEPSISQLWKF